MQKITALVLLALCTAGCVTTGTKADPNAVAGFQPGVTTLDQVEARLGRPYSVSRTADASTIVAYSFANDQAGGSNHRTFISAFADDTGGNKDMVVLNFDKGSKFVSSTLTQSTASAGLFSQK
ncbi:hypothetical protein [Rhodanobacter sp. A1T4]|uniref:hypothetical protein n=1 Tax=Rhodanobacter sp. A1T4 TaxID=2723087 RepID=UPI001622C0BD|nr:hypothetical protein [Rhodanobacter sp. A1T4]MBB6249057.1 hypothetical protein [Rhodanobacter sp. A1T4]